MTALPRPEPSRRRTLRALVALIGFVGVLVIGPSAVAAPGPGPYPEYWFDQWGVAQLWASGVRGAGITVAVIDTGVQASIPQLSSSVLPGTDLTGQGGDGGTDRSRPQFSHGTAMASVIVAHGGDGYVNGVAPAAKILPIAVPLGETASTQPQDDETAAAIRYAADHGANIVNMSFGAERTPAEDSQPCPAPTQAAVFYALRKGLVLVASSGNSAQTGSPVDEPGVCLGVISVGAVDSGDQRAPFSSAHPYLTVTAPGVAVTSLNRAGEVYVGAGTSQAAALTSGALALIWSAHPSESGRSITARLMAGLRDAGPAGRDPAYGFGIVDALRSVDSTPNASTPNPVFAAADPFLAQLAARPQQLAAPRKAAVKGLAGSYRRNPPTTGLSPATRLGLGIGGVGLVWLGGLLVFGRRRRRRRRSRLASEPSASSDCRAG